MERRLSNRQRTRQSGYALILMVLGLMGVGGVVIVGFTQQAKQDLEVQRFQHNQRVLEQAKQALLMFAYNYPQTNIGIGPGRLPCPDHDNNGAIEFPPNCVPVGRFPWADDRLGTQELLDASGERLWYAVSSAFGNFPVGGVINYDTTGTITLVDQSGGIIYDGNGAGIAAVIIAPGTILKRDDNADGTYEYTQVRNTDPQKIDPRNYLDTFDGFDNSAFTNGSIANTIPPPGFILGPVNDIAQSTIVINDQLIIVTADEIIAMAEKVTVQAYRTTIDAYLDKAGTCTGTGTNRSLCELGGGTWNPVYPWLYNYEGIEYDSGGGELVDVAIKKLSTFFPALADSCSDPSKVTEADCLGSGDIWGFHDEKATYLGIDASGNDGIFGRIPPMFGEYFTETDSQPIETPLSGSITLNDSGGDSVTLTQSGGGSADNAFNDGPVLAFDTPVLTDVKFLDLGDPEKGQLTATFPGPKQFSYEVFFWDEDNATQQGWTTCPGGADQLIDCVGVSAHGKARILHMTVTLKFDDPSGIESFDLDYTPAPEIVVMPATATAHASITATYAASEVISFTGTITATYEFEQHFHYSDGDSTTTLNIVDGSYAIGTVDMTDFTRGPLSLGIRYYPELPGWALDNEWHNSIRMAYALEYAPPGTGPPCTVTTCLKLDDAPGQPQDKISLLVFARQHNWVDGHSGNPANDKLKNDLLTVFDEGNHNDNPTFYLHRGNDKILVIDEL
jgi:hypothetical protein